MSICRRARTSAALVITTAALLLLNACGDDASVTPPATAQTAPNGDVHNDADVAFLEQMIPHHAQAVQMVALTRGRPLDPAVEAIANEIRDAQVPEVEQMSGWLTAWGKDVPATSMDHANADSSTGGMGDMDTGDMPGMMSSEDMQSLQDMPDAEFQARWLELMVEHHTGAVEMARTEQASGRFPGALALATSIESSQTAEIATLEKLLG